MGKPNQKKEIICGYIVFLQVSKICGKIYVMKFKIWYVKLADLLLIIQQYSIVELFNMKKLEPSCMPDVGSIKSFRRM